VDGTPVDQDNPLHLIINEHKPGDKVKLKVWRSGEIKEITVGLVESK
jgi:S1-C subfamily serine protease